VRDKNLLLVDTDTGEMIYPLDSGFESYDHRSFIWMRNDLYPYPVRFSSLYDTFTGQRLDRWRRDPFFPLRYSPMNQHFIMKRTDGTYLMSEWMPKPVLMYKHRPVNRSMFQYQWDMARNELLVIFFGNTGYLTIYNIETGETKAVLSHPEGCAVPLEFKRTDDNRTPLIYTDASKASTQARCKPLGN
jgi:hypothetical protein